MGSGERARLWGQNTGCSREPVTALLWASVAHLKWTSDGWTQCSPGRPDEGLAPLILGQQGLERLQCRQLPNILGFVLLL